jgi:hypothetical protein
MLSEQDARSLAERAVDRLGGAAALDSLFQEADEPYPAQELIVDDYRVFVRLRHPSGPASAATPSIFGIDIWCWPVRVRMIERPFPMGARR